MAATTDLIYNTKEEILLSTSELRKSFDTGITLDIAFRKHQLKQLSFLLNENVEAIADAITKDLGRSRFESVFAEIMLTTNSVIEAYENVKVWSRNQSRWAGIVWALHSPTERKEPKGTVLVLGAWNYPISVQVGPIIGALCAGCTVVLKPSEISPHSAQLLADLWPKYMDPRMSRIINGGIEETTQLLDMRWEHIFYTGNGRVGRIVAEKAARWICPTTLELGGKSPVFIDESANLNIAAHRIMWAKSVNCGQTCIAPDYVICTPKVQDRLLVELEKVYDEFWPKGARQSPDYGRIVNERQFNRLESIVANTKGAIVIGGNRDASIKFFEPTIIKDVPHDDISMREDMEIFGPILPIVTVKDIDEGCIFVNRRDQPLALYIFGNNKVSDKIIHNTRSGGLVQGDLMLHYVVSDLPFGGTGLSGYGSYHGRAGFETFSHTRCSIHAPAVGVMGWITEKLMASRYPPYTSSKLTKLQALVGKSLPFRRPPHNYEATQKSA
jgi:acyl-CoA reductase-like NAD-dependent aldehyde dehydrogenase